MAEPLAPLDTPDAPGGATGEAPPRRARPAGGRRRLARNVALALLVVAAVGGVLFWQYARVRESTDDAQIEGNIVPIAARVGGTVLEVRVADNQHVAAGDVLAVIDPVDYQVALRRAEAELADAEAAAEAARTAVPIASETTSSQLENARAAVAAARKDADAARARRAEAQAGLNKAAADLARYTSLLAKDEVSRQQFDQAVAQEASSRAAVAAADAQIAAAESKIAQAVAAERGAGTAPQQVAVTRARSGAADAAVMKSRAAVEQARLNLGYTTVKAPAAGVVSRKAVQPGQIVQPGQPLCAIVPLEDVWVVANFKENQLRRMRVGQPVDVYVDAYGHSYRGRVQSIGGATAAKFSLLPPENATGNFVKVVQRVPVKIVFEQGQDPEHLLRPGMSVEPTVLTR